MLAVSHQSRFATATYFIQSQSVISGVWEITASDGEVRRFAQGDVVLVEDTIGKGHASCVVSDQDSLALLVNLV